MKSARLMPLGVEGSFAYLSPSVIGGETMKTQKDIAKTLIELTHVAEFISHLMRIANELFNQLSVANQEKCLIWLNKRVGA